MTLPAPEDRIVSLPDRYIPVFQVYFAHDTFQPPRSAAGAPMPGVAKALATEADRIQKRIVHVTGPGTAVPAQGQLIPLAGPYGDDPKQQTNDVISVQFKEDIDGGLATVTVDVFNVYDFSKKLYRYTDDHSQNPQGTGPLLDYGVTLALLLGYQKPKAAASSTFPSTVAPVFEGMINKLDLSFPADGPPTVKITAVDKRERLRNQKGLKPTVFVGVTEEEIAATVAAQMGLKVATRENQKTMPKGKVQLSPDQDALQFLTDRAKKAALELSCFGDTIFLLSPGDNIGQTPIRYEYRRGLSSFSTSMDGTGKPTSVKLTARDPFRQKTYTATVTVKDLQDKQLAPAGSTVADVIRSQGQGGDRVEVVTNYHATSQEEATNLALGILKRNLDSALTASGEVIGDPAVRAGTLLDVQGVGSHYTGPYYVTSATHTYGSGGYQTSFEARRNGAPGTGSTT